jgi:hypothetical protein
VGVSGCSAGATEPGQTYAAMDPLEGRMTRRMWWIMYSGDRSAACCEGERMLINEDDVGDVAMAFEK